MIHYSCDRCKKPIARDALRYEVKIDMQLAIESDEEIQNDDDRDHLSDVDEWLQRIDDECEELCEQFYQSRRFDLCSECYEQFVRNPLASEPQIQVGFSEN